MDKSPMSEFLLAFEKQKKKEKDCQDKRDKIREAKARLLEPVRNLLNDFRAYEVVLTNGQLFVWYEKESSPSWQPGASLCFDNPAEVEVAIPNDRLDEGVIVIRVASSHKDESMLNRRFDTVEMACKALAKFIGQNTKSIKGDLREGE